ncbi:TrkH family potassium uptake protein, partial [Dietzia cinnamea]|nr:TrkH family potassium uptake protein [Dietzia cinnamea]
MSPPVWRRWAGWATLSPVRVVALSFAAAIVVGTGLLLLPAAVASGGATSVTD